MESLKAFFVEYEKVLVGLAAIAAVLFTIPFSWFIKKLKESKNANHYLEQELKNTKSRLIAAQSQLSLYDPNIFTKRLDSLSSAGAAQKELQNASEEYLYYQSKAITSAASHLAEKSLYNVQEDGSAALHEAKRWLSLGLSVSPRNPALTEVMDTVNQRLNAEKLDLPTKTLEIDSNLNFKQLKQVTTDLTTKANYSLAEYYAKHCIAVARQQFGESDGRYGFALTCLARVLALTGREYEAEPLYRASLKSSLRAFGEGHFDYGYALNNLGGLLRSVGEFQEAEPLFRQALGIFEKTLGKQHQSYNTCLNNLALLLKQVGRFDESEALFKQVLGNERKGLEEEDSTVSGTTLGNFADMLRTTGRFEEAEPLFRQAVDVFEKSLGPEHPDTVSSKANLEKLLTEQSSRN